jgi:S1-C subfamily serine protease
MIGKDRRRSKEHTVSESSGAGAGEGFGGGWGAGTTTLPPAGMEWEVPSSTGGTGGGLPPEFGLGGQSTPPPRQPVRGVTAAFVAVAVAVAAFLAAGPLHSRITLAPTTNGGVTIPVSPFRPNGGNAADQSQPPATTSSATSNLSADQISAIAAKVDQGVVDINTELGYQNGEAAGTGMILTPNGEILTNNHVIDGSTKISVTVVATGKTYTAKVVGTDPSEDVAVIQLQGASGLKPITTATLSSVSIGDPVVAVGNAGGRGGTPSVAAGSVVATGQAITATDDNGGNAERLTDLIQVDANIESGDSGGPLANKAGDVIGMDSAAEVSGSRFRSDSTSGYAITIEKAVSVAKQIESGKATSTIHIGLPSFLGVQMAGTGAGGGQGRRTTTVPSTNGALIAGVEQGTPAADIGLGAGDTITSVNGQAVTSASGLTTALQATHPGDQVTIGWVDQSGAQHSAKATLTTGPAD